MRKFIKNRWYLILILVLIAGFIFYKKNTASAAKNKVDDEYSPHDATDK